MKILKIIFLFIFITSCRTSEEVKKTNYVLEEGNFKAYSGLIAPSAKEYLALEGAKMIRSFAGLSDTEFSKLPPSVDLASQLPEAGNQGEQNSCAGWALGFAVRSFQENRELGWGMTPNHLFSPSFIYNQLNQGKDEGVDLIDAMDFLMKNGAVPLSLMEYKDSDYLKQPDDLSKKVALGFTALGYRRIDEKNVLHLKAYLASGEPVVVVIEMFDNFLPRGMKKSGNVYKEKGNKSLGYHALIAVGYDDAKKAFKLLNSWGGQWGDAGYGWLAYDFASVVIKQAYVIYDTPTSQVVVAAINSPSNMQVAFMSGPVTIPVTLPKGGQGDARLAVGRKVGVSLATDTVMIVPDEGGITINDQWFRLGSALEEADLFFTEKTSSLFRDYDPRSGDIKVQDDDLNDKLADKIHFYKQESIPVYTNLGITFGSSREDVHRIYGAPDLAKETFDKTKQDTAWRENMDVYFFHAVMEKWGGIKITKHASLMFTFDSKDEVIFMALENVFKDSLLGDKGYKEFKESEKQVLPEGTLIKSDDGKITFFVPSQFTEIKKTVWAGSGYGYFADDSEKGDGEYLNIKIYQLDHQVDDHLLRERIATINAYGKAYDFKGVEPQEVLVAGASCLQVDLVDMGNVRNYYCGFGMSLLEIQISSNQPLSGLKWPQAFLNSVKISP